MEFVTFPVGEYAVNCTLVSGPGATCIVIDPGQDAEVILRELSARRWTPAAILLTHAHFDHIGAVPAILAKYPQLPVAVHPDDAVMFGHPLNACPPEYPSVAKPATLVDARTFRPDGFDYAVLHTPGHTPGSVCYRFGDTLFSGDTLFAGSCGRTDFPGGSMAAMRKSLAALAQLPRETVVVPGHGPGTTIGAEILHNPFMSVG